MPHGIYRLEPLTHDTGDIRYIFFVGNLAVMYYRTGQNAKKIDKLGETIVHAIERLEERMDKRFVEMNKRIDDTNQQIADFRVEVNQDFSDFRVEMNQRFVQVHSEINHVRDELSKLNQNHIDHLTHHKER